MKKIIFSILLSCVALTIQAQQKERFIFATTIGTGFAMSTPSSTPFTWQILGSYAISKQFSAGIGTGLSFYEKTLIPLFANAKFAVVKPRTFTPYLECSAGYSFAPSKDTNGGFYLNPSIGIQYSVCRNKKLSFALGYEFQKLERLKRQEQALFTTEFVECLNHNFISVKMGFIF